MTEAVTAVRKIVEFAGELVREGDGKRRLTGFELQNILCRAFRVCDIGEIEPMLEKAR